jgi:hypothetical protein
MLSMQSLQMTTRVCVAGTHDHTGEGEAEAGESPDAFAPSEIVKGRNLFLAGID